MSRTITRVSSAFLRQQRPFNLRLQSNYATKPPVAPKKAAKRAVKKVKYQFNKMIAGKSTRKELVGWVFLGIVGFYLVRKIVS